jgi:hypothetical protein
MAIQDDLDRIVEQLDKQSPNTLALHAYAAYKLLCSKIPKSVSNGSFEIFISDSPQYSELLEREVSKILTATIKVEEIIGVDMDVS